MKIVKWLDYKEVGPGKQSIKEEPLGWVFLDMLSHSKCAIPIGLTCWTMLTPRPIPLSDENGIGIELPYFHLQVQSDSITNR